MELMSNRQSSSLGGVGCTWDGPGGGGLFGGLLGDAVGESDFLGDVVGAAEWALGDGVGVSELGEADVPRGAVDDGLVLGTSLGVTRAN